MKAFIWNGVHYLRCVPAKSLFRSTLVHEVVNRGDIFAIRISDQALTIVPGNAVVEHISMDCVLSPKTDTVTVAAMRKKLVDKRLKGAISDKIRQLDLELSQGEKL